MNISTWIGVAFTCLPVEAIAHHKPIIISRGEVERHEFSHVPTEADTVYDSASEELFVDWNPVGYQGYDYATVLIGNHCWFQEELNAYFYRNGDSIPNGPELVEAGTEWYPWSGQNGAYIPRNLLFVVLS